MGIRKSYNLSLEKKEDGRGSFYNNGIR